MKYLIGIVMLIVLISACATKTLEQEFGEVETLIETGNYENAKDICDRVLEKDSLTNFSVKDLCRLSVLYMKLMEQNEEDDNLILAEQCYRQAIACDSDSAVLYYSILPIDDAQYVALLHALVCGIKEVDIETYEENCY